RRIRPPSPLRRLVGKISAPRTDQAISPQRYWRRQCRCAHKTAGDGARSCRRRYRGQTRFWPVGANFLWRVRWPAATTGAGENYRRIVLFWVHRDLSFPHALSGGSTRLATLRLSKWNPGEFGTGPPIKALGGEDARKNSFDTPRMG